MKLKVYVDGKELPINEIEDWERKRSAEVAKYLKSEFNKSVPLEILNPNNNLDINYIREELVKAKLSIDENHIRLKLKNKLKFSNISARFLNIASLGKRKSSVVEIVGQDCNVEKVFKEINNLMLKNSPENLKLCLMGSPDHYILKGHKNNIQEIIETTGGAPIQSQFFISYGDEDGISYPKGESYPMQMAGICRLSNGTVIGDVRHQYRSEGTGFRVKLADGFPIIFPKKLIEAHQMHLACEFLIWYDYIIKQY